MKRALYLGASIGALIVVGSSAQAADLAVKAPIMRPPPIFSWTGCYVGGHVGWGWSRHKVRETGLDSSSANIISASGNIDTSGAVFGGQVGCNYQFSGNWVVGIEGMGAATDLHGSQLNPRDLVTLSDL